MRQATLALYVIGAASAWAFVVGYWLRTHGGWRRSPEGWHLMTFTASVGLIFTLLSVVRVLPLLAARVVFLILVAAIDVGLIWRFVLMQTATRNAKARRHP
jgi:hypothetical protein